MLNAELRKENKKITCFFSCNCLTVHASSHFWRSCQDSTTTLDSQRRTQRARRDIDSKNTDLNSKTMHEFVDDVDIEEKCKKNFEMPDDNPAAGPADQVPPDKNRSLS